MSRIPTLNDLKQGQKARVKKIMSKGTIRRRLQDMGFIEGSLVECLQRSPLGDPTAYLVKGCVIALRSEDSSSILVTEVL
ncbi:MAG: ferrous iron transport protein A [Clostridiaceae bacterium]|nr:ferrous iron transport protein A [Clostridiaceae bacterium]